MNEIVPGVFHWKAKHPNIGADVSCYYLAAERVLIDPMQPEEGLDWFRENGPPEHILLSNRHHDRDSAAFVEAFGCTVHASRPGMHEFSDDQKVEPFDFGDELPGGVVAREVGALSPDEGALHIPGQRALAVADGVVEWPGVAGLAFVPDFLMDEPERTKADLRDAYSRLSELDLELLLLTHGQPVVGAASEALRAFALAR
jgi:hypothetical protein